MDIIGSALVLMIKHVQYVDGISNLLLLQCPTCTNFALGFYCGLVAM